MNVDTAVTEKKLSSKYFNRYVIDREKKQTITQKHIRSREPSTSPSFRRSLTPSLDPKLLRQFEEEDRPRRVLRSSTVAASIPKITITNSSNTIINDTTNKINNPIFNIGMIAKDSAKRKPILAGDRKRKKSEANFTTANNNNTFPVENIFYTAKLTTTTTTNGLKRKRSSEAKESNKKRLKVN